MAKDPEPKPKAWTPDQPLEDEEDEKECQRRAMASARVDFLREQVSKPPKEKKEKKALW